MSLTQTQKDQISKLIQYRDDIENSIFHLEKIIKTYFPEEFEAAYQHWIPQIATALYDYDKWLPRGSQTLQDTINRLTDKATENKKSDHTTHKFI